MSYRKDGEHIRLFFEDYENEEFFKGWLSLDQCQGAIKETYCNDCEILRVIRKGYARFNVSRNECGEPISVLCEVEKPSKGVFKITVCESRGSLD